MDKSLQKKFSGLLLFFWWGVWKERNRRIFQQDCMPAKELASLIKSDILSFVVANHVIE